MIEGYLMVMSKKEAMY